MEDEPKERVKFSKSEREQRAIEVKEAAALDSRLRREHRDQKTARLRALRLAKEECDANARALAKT